MLHGLPASAEAYKGVAGYAGRLAATHGVPFLKRRFARYGATFFGFYIGTRDPYTNFIADNKRLDRELTAAGIPHVFKLYPGAHDGTFWRMHQDQWLDTAVDRLDPPTW